MTTKKSIKISNEGIEFLKRLKNNRIKIDTDKEGLAYWELMDLIAKYFKVDNNSYLCLTKMKIDKNV